MCPSSSTTATATTRSLKSPLKSLKRSYATRGRVASFTVGATGTKRPRLHHSLLSSAAGNSVGDNDDLLRPLSPENEEPHIVSRDNSSDDESGSDTASDEEMTSVSKILSMKRGPVRFRHRPRLSIYNKVPCTVHMDGIEDEDDATSCCSVSVISLPAHSVHFAPNLVSQVMEIPSHRSYNPVEKSQIWNSLTTLRKEAKRNRIEWQWEGCSFENAAEEHEFVPDQLGNFFHPAHI